MTVSTLKKVKPFQLANKIFYSLNNPEYFENVPSLEVQLAAVGIYLEIVEGGFYDACGVIGCELSEAGSSKDIELFKAGLKQAEKFLHEALRAAARRGAIKK